MLKKLTTEQESLMFKVRDEWLDIMFKNRKPIDTKQATIGIKWLYEFSGLSEPKIIFVDSPLAVQYACNLVRSNVRSNVESNVWSNVRSNVWSNVRSNVESNVRSNVRSNVESNVWSNVWSNVSLSYYNFSYYGNISDWGWCSFYDFFTRIKIINDKNFNKFLKLIRSNIFEMVQLDGLCVVCGLPKELYRDKENRLHNDTGKPAISWSDGYEIYFLHGVSFDKELYRKVIDRKLTGEEIMSIQNIEQRMIALKYADSEIMLNSLNGKMINKSDRGNELWLIEDFQSFPKAYFLRYTCPSTGRIYVSGVDPDFAEGKTADECMAWKFRLTLQNYIEMKIES